MLVTDYLLRAVERHPDKPVLFHDTRIFTYREAFSAALGIASRLLEYRLEPGFRGAILNDDPFEYIAAYFGILLDSKIIKFNQDGIRLKAVEIGCDFISLTYGTDKQVQNTRLLREAIDRGELKGIAEKFRYETGIVPVIID